MAGIQLGLGLTYGARSLKQKEQKEQRETGSVDDDDKYKDGSRVVRAKKEVKYTYRCWCWVVSS